MSTTTGKQAAAAAKTLLADRIALVETLGAALDTHRRAEEAVTTARAAATTAAQQARDAYDTAKTGGWTAAELTKAVADHGKALPTELTDAGRGQLRAASVAVRTVEKQMLAPLTPSAQQRLFADLAACATALTG